MRASLDVKDVSSAPLEIKVSVEIDTNAAVKQISGEYPCALASGIRSVAMRVAPNIAEWVSGK